MNPEDLDSLAEYATPVVAGEDTIVAITRPDLESNTYLTQLFAFRGESSQRITHGWRDSAPHIGEHWSGYLSAEKSERPQLFAGPSLATAHRITDNHLGVTEFDIDDAGSRALYVARVAESGRYGSDDDIPAEEEAPRRITSAAYHANGLGYVGDRPARAFLVDLVEPGLGKAGITGSAEVPLSTMLQTPESDVHDPRFSPSGARMSVIADVTPDRGEPDLRSTVWLLGSDGPEALELPRMSVSLHRWIDDGRVLLVGADLTRDALDFVGQMPGLFVHDLSTGTTRRLTDPETVAIASLPAIVVGESAVVAVDTDGATRLARIDLSAEAVGLDDLRFLTDALSVVTGFAVDGGTAVATAVTPESPAVLIRVGLDGSGADGPSPTAGATEIAGDSSIEGGVMDANAVADLVDDEHPHADSTLADAHAAGEDDMYDSDVAAVSSAESGLAVAGVADAAEAAGATASAGETGPSVLRAHPAPANSVLPRLLRVDGEGGTITGWLAKPTGQGPFPVVLNIHGGPFAQYTHGWFDETQVLTSAGYAVVYANPRGSGGRTRTWGTAVQGNMAEPAMADVLAVLEHALALDSDLDGDRLGVQGGSYGGYLTAMTIAADHRFRAAIVERGYLDPHSFVGTSDIGRFFSEEYTSRDAAAIERQSPLAHAGQVRTPALVMHSELDFRCPLEQAQQYYAALQRAGVETELLIFPGENHELSRSGQPRHRRQRFDAIIDWWDTHLGGRPAESATDDRPLTTAVVR